MCSPLDLKTQLFESTNKESIINQSVFKEPLTTILMKMMIVSMTNIILYDDGSNIKLSRSKKDHAEVIYI